MSVKKILVAVDGSASARRAVEWTAGLAARTGATVIAAHVISDPEWPVRTRPSLAPLPPDYPQRWREEVREALVDGWTDPLHDLGPRLETRLLGGQPAKVLLAVAAEEDCDLVVLGNRGRGGLRELLLGSVSSNVLLNATSPVAVIRGGLEVPVGLRTIVVGIDSSPGSVAAVDWTAELAGAVGAEVVLCSVIPVDADPEIAYGGALEVELQGLRERLERRCAPIRGHGVTCRTEAAVGAPAATLMDLARREGAGLIVVGSRGLGGVRSRMLGSVGNQLAHHVDRPLVVVRPGTRTRHERPAAEVAEADGTTWTGVL